MNIVTLNCCGINSEDKISGVRNMVKLLNLNVIGLQESKSECIDASLVNSIWGSDSNEFVYGPSIRASGGTHLIWDPIVFQKELVLSGANFSGVVGRWHVRVQQERVGCFFFISEATTFNDFIAKSGLLDFQMGNHRFTRFNREGTKMSKLDRFLVSQNFFNFWNNASVLALPRTLSDHCPVLLTVGTKQCGPKAFKIFDHWFTVPGFDSLVNKSWLKEELKKRIFDWDQKAELGSLSPNDVDAREELLIELMHLEQNDRNSLKQKSRVKWAIEGDENTKFFHTLENKKARKQAINGLIWNGSWTEDMDTIKNADFAHYQDRFKESTHQRPKFRSSLFRKLEATNATFLEASISMDEIKDVVWSCSGSKSPGPDDGYLIANKIINYAKSEDSRLLLFKVDFEKAFDSVNWSFLHDIMQQMGFGVQWRKWVNASTEALQVLTLDACNKCVYKGLSLAEDGANVSLLQYADDALFFGEWS
ncbi:RNA-directed DNA polymerase, eukaryota [Tanacetum coccineum]